MHVCFCVSDVLIVTDCLSLWAQIVSASHKHSWQLPYSNDSLILSPLTAHPLTGTEWLLFVSCVLYCWCTCGFCACVIDLCAPPSTLANWNRWRSWGGRGGTPRAAVMKGEKRHRACQGHQERRQREPTHFPSTCKQTLFSNRHFLMNYPEGVRHIT